MDHAHASQLAERWITDWNRHDLKQILSHYSPTATLASPVAQRFGVRGGTVIGRSALADYFGAGLAAAKDLAFESEVVLAGVGGLTVVYRNHRQQRCAETMFFGDDGRIHTAHAHYAPAPHR